MKERVILLHGLGGNGLKMMPLAVVLEREGFAVSNLSYPSTRYRIEELTAGFLAPLVARHRGERLHFIAHSLGGIMLRHYLSTPALSQQGPEIGKVVMMGSAHHGSEILELYRRHPLFAAAYGPATQQSGTGAHCFPCGLHEQVTYALGVIAGYVPLDPLSWLVMPWPHDGRSSVRSTALPGMQDQVLVPSPHEALPFHPLAMRQAVQFLKSGRFGRCGFRGIPGSIPTAAAAQFSAPVSAGGKAC